MAAPRGRKNYRYDALTRYPAWTHVDALYWAEDWEKIRDCLLGEREIKEKGDYYLPRLDSQTPKEYVSYLDRAVFYNMTGRTINGMHGTIYRRPPKFSNVPKRLEAQLKTITRNGLSILQFVKAVCREQLAMGRYGALVDMDRDGRKPPYIAGYCAENILDWVTEEIDGRDVPTRVVIRDIMQIDQGVGKPRKYGFIYRVLLLENGVYHQDIYTVDDIHADLSSVKPVRVTPTKRGNTLDFIPFVFFGSETLSPDCDRSPVVDIVALNLSHYKSYAQLEHGRFYTAMPIYYAQVQGDGSGTDYVIGPNVVWECAVGEKPGVIEFNGNGLKSLENACNQKESQIAALGGRLLGGQDRSVAESDNAVALKDKNERSVLLNVVQVLDEGMSILLDWWAWWQDEDKPAIEVEHNTDFLLENIGARELRAVYLMYQDGAVPVTVLYEYMRKAEVIPDYISADDFKRMLDQSDEFPNNPDFAARQAGYRTKQAQDTAEEKERELDIEQQLADAQTGQVDLGHDQLAHDEQVAQDKTKLDQQRVNIEKQKAKQPAVPASVGALRSATGVSVKPRRPSVSAKPKLPKAA